MQSPTLAHMPAGAGARSFGMMPGTMPPTTMQPGTLPPGALPYPYGPHGAAAGMPPGTLPPGSFQSMPPTSLHATLRPAMMPPASVPYGSQAPTPSPAEYEGLNEALAKSTAEVGAEKLEKEPLVNDKGFMGFGFGAAHSEHLVKSLTEVPPGILKMFPTIFLLFCLSLFVMPIYLLWYVDGDINVRKWLDHYGALVAILPVVYFTTFLYHMFTRKPSRVLIILSLIGSCVLLLVVSNLTLVSAYQNGPMLASTDCLSWSSKRHVQQQWDMARDFYATCVKALAKKKDMKFAAAVTAFRIEDCPGYKMQASDHPDWSYLASLEKTQKCSGWCEFEPPLWVKTRTEDACSPVVAQALKDKAQHVLKQVVIYTAFTLCAVSMILIGVQPLLRKYQTEL